MRQKDRSPHKINDFMAVRLFCFRLNNLFSFQIQRGVLGLYYLHLLQISRLRVNLSKLNKVKTNCVVSVIFLRKEVIQPHLPIRLPCYDFTPIIYPTLGGWLQKGYLTDFGCYKLSWCDGRCVQGPGTYSPRRADPRLLAIPASCRRVAACNPN